MFVANSAMRTGEKTILWFVEERTCSMPVKKCECCQPARFRVFAPHIVGSVGNNHSLHTSQERLQFAIGKFMNRECLFAAQH